MNYGEFKKGQRVQGTRYMYKAIVGTVVARPYPPAGTVPVLYEFADGSVLQYEQPSDIKAMK